MRVRPCFNVEPVHMALLQRVAGRVRRALLGLTRWGFTARSVALELSPTMGLQCVVSVGQAHTLLGDLGHVPRVLLVSTIQTMEAWRVSLVTLDIIHSVERKTARHATLVSYPLLDPACVLHVRQENTRHRGHSSVPSVSLGHGATRLLGLSWIVPGVALEGTLRHWALTLQGFVERVHQAPSQLRPLHLM